MNNKNKQLRHKPIAAWKFKFLLNLYPPMLAAGIKMTHLSDDYRDITVILKQRWYNTNYVGTIFGGAMYTMADPFYMLILLRNLGEQYIVWDKAASIDFKKPGRGTLTAIFRFSDEELQEIRNQADQRDKYVFDKPVDLVDQDGVIAATVIKTLYVRRKT